MTTKPKAKQYYDRNRPKYVNCSYCGEALPDEEIRMQAANHRACFKFAIHTKAAWGEK